MAEAVLHRERLRPPVGWWVLAAILVGSVVLAYDAAGGPVWAVPAGLLAAAMTGWWLLGPATLDILVDSDGLHVGAACLPFWAMGPASALDPAETSAARGRDADPRGYYAITGHVRTAVRVVVDDPADPVPSWLVSSRAPSALVAALDAGRAIRPRSPGR
jgi:hypothetical protein